MSVVVQVETCTQDQDFYQRRVARFGQIGAALGGLHLAFRVALLLSSGNLTALTDPSLGLHSIGVLVLASMWFVTQGKTRTPQFVGAVELVGVLGSAIIFTAMAAFLPQTARPELVGCLSLTLGLLARAIYVPSTASRTLWVTTIAGLPLCFLAVAVYTPPPRSDPVAWVDQDVATIALGTAGWWLITVFLSTATSSVIYGLQRKALSARRLGRYTLEEKLGAGGMGEVYRACHALLRRPTAIKLLPPERAGKQNLSRFRREVQLTAKLSHPNTVTIFDYGTTPDGVFYYAMELLDGVTLDAIVDIDGPMPPGRVIHVLVQVAGALAEAHGIGLIHRDIKPANIILGQRGGIPDFATVVDFGLVKDITRNDATSSYDASIIVGTPSYVSPETIRCPNSVGPQSDLYSLGAVGYFLLTGQRVFAASHTPAAIYDQHLHAPPRRPSERLGRATPPDLEAIIMQCLEKDPQNRPESAVTLRTDLCACNNANDWDLGLAAAWWATHADALQRWRANAAKDNFVATLPAGPDPQLVADPKAAPAR